MHCRLARESAAFYGEATELLDGAGRAPLHALRLSLPRPLRAALERLRANAAVQNAAGVPSRIVTPDEAAGLVPGPRTESLTGAAWCDEDGYFDRPQSVVEAFAARTRTFEIARRRSLCAATRGLGGSSYGTAACVRPSTVVVAAGIDAASCSPRSASSFRSSPRSRRLFLSEPIHERLVEPLVVSAERALRGEAARRRPRAGERSLRRGQLATDAPRWREAVRRSIRELLPVLEYVDFTVLARGVYDSTPDRQAIIGAGARPRGPLGRRRASAGTASCSPLRSAGSSPRRHGRRRRPRPRRRSTPRASTRSGSCPSHRSSRCLPRRLVDDGVELELDERRLPGRARDEIGRVRRPAPRSLGMGAHHGFDVAARREQQPRPQDVFGAGAKLRPRPRAPADRPQRLLVGVARGAARRRQARQPSRSPPRSCPADRPRVGRGSSKPPPLARYVSRGRLTEIRVGRKKWPAVCSRPMTEMRLYDLRVTVERIEGRSVCGLEVGDFFEVTESSRVRIPEGRHFCLYALQAVLPLLPAKQRRLPEEDWLEQDNLVCCPDPDERVVMRIERIGERTLRTEDLT